ncbi:MAG TPA: MAPEG family protein [Burkholderiales bacterium]|nr:MAPEG family protein [Burkholderiales bacterium]
MDKAIFLPAAALVALTLGVAVLLLRARFRAGFRRQVTLGDFRYGESERVPPEARLPSRNYVNLLEMPLLFYVACVVLYAIGAVDGAAIALAWVYAATRALHSLIHLTYNNVLHRLAMFAASTVVLLVIWIRLVLAVLK